jgi:hypothetical protein
LRRSNLPAVKIVFLELKSERFDLGVASQEAEPALALWASARGLGVGHIDGAPFDTNELERVAERIENKQAQLPPDGPGFIVIHSSHLIADCPEVRRAIEFFDPIVRVYGHVCGVVIIGEYPGCHTETVDFGPHQFCIAPEYDMYSQYKLVIVNPDATVAIVPQTKGRITHALLYTPNMSLQFH